MVISLGFTVFNQENSVVTYRTSSLKTVIFGELAAVTAFPVSFWSPSITLILTPQFSPLPFFLPAVSTVLLPSPSLPLSSTHSALHRCKNAGEKKIFKKIITFQNVGK